MFQKFYNIGRNIKNTYINWSMLKYRHVNIWFCYNQVKYKNRYDIIFTFISGKGLDIIMVHFVGAGSGAADLITVRGKKLVDSADVVIYAGSLVNPQLLEDCKEDCKIYNSAKMTLEEVIDVIQMAEENNKTTVRLHTGDPCLYGAIREQMDVLDSKNIQYDYYLMCHSQ